MRTVNYAKLDHAWSQHHARFVAFVQERCAHLHCMECGGAGGEIEIVDPELGGPWLPCGWCEGTGLMTPYGRAAWLRMRREQ